MKNSDSAKITPDQSFQLLDELQSLLNEQIRLVRKGDFSASGALTEETDGLVEQLGQMGLSEHSDFERRFERLVKSYRTVIFSFAAEKDRLEKQLQKIGRGRKTLRAYRGY
jgi:hypothetical protein